MLELKATRSSECISSGGKLYGLKRRAVIKFKSPLEIVKFKDEISYPTTSAKFKPP
ncbi:hypothetical protein [uncultured Campylobacter sp.]|uniref:hypothetical protein n=1 Tax=uncultured Campylobacter sp. TaxID=218934 RepID=UPI002617A895|nr:hypothetical protein [uncultured Campylobacter sp.]